PTRDAIRQGFAFHQLENQETSALRLLDIMNRRDVGVIERRQCFGFTLKAAKAIVIAREFFGQYLDGDVAFQSRIARTVDLTHPAFTQQCSNLVRTELRADRQRHGVWWPRL